VAFKDMIPFQCSVPTLALSGRDCTWMGNCQGTFGALLFLYYPETTFSAFTKRALETLNASVFGLISYGYALANHL